MHTTSELGTNERVGVAKDNTCLLLAATSNSWPKQQQLPLVNIQKSMSCMNILHLIFVTLDDCMASF